LQSIYSSRRRDGTFVGIILGRGRLQPLSLPLSHEFFIFRGAGTRRRVRRQAAEPTREIIAHSIRELLVDGPASR